MKITKYPQSCLLVEAGGKKLLFDPGVLKFCDDFIEPWSEADAVFVTHKHPDHCNADLVAGFDIPLYATAEVVKAYPALKRASIIKEGDCVKIGGVSVTPVKAVHGYHPNMRGNEVYENVGFTIFDGEKTFYITSDTICFPCPIKADAVALPVTGFGVTMTAFEASLFAKETGAGTILLTHMDNPAFDVDWDYINRYFGKAGVGYTYLEIGESLEV